MNNTRILISFCNQLASPDHAFCTLDPLNGDARWINFSDIPEELRQNSLGVTGICHIGRDVVIATQGPRPLLLRCNIDEARVVSYIELKKSKDTHSLVFNDGYIYLVSTGTNQIYKLSFNDGHFGEEELYWSYPETNNDRDEVHLNGLTIDLDGFIASCFGPKRRDGKWGSEGRIFYIQSGNTIHGSLTQPHSPLVDGQRLVFAESAVNKIHIYNKEVHETWAFDRELSLEGYARGIVLKNDHLWVGISADRKLSRSQHVFLDNERRNSSDSAIIEINLKTGRIQSNLGLLGFGREVYDLLEINTTLQQRPGHDAINARIRAMESSVDKYAAKLNSILDLNRILQEEITNNTWQHDAQIERIYKTVSWRITLPLRVLGGILSRLRSK